MNLTFWKIATFMLIALLLVGFGVIISKVFDSRSSTPEITSNTTFMDDNRIAHSNQNKTPSLQNTNSKRNSEIQSKRESNSQSQDNDLKKMKPTPELISSVPQEAKDAAIKYVKDENSSIYEQKDFKVGCAKRLDTNPADDANEVREKWCVALSFIARRRGATDWYYVDLSNDETGSVFFRKNDKWEKSIGASCRCR